MKLTKFEKQILMASRFNDEGDAADDEIYATSIIAEAGIEPYIASDVISGLVQQGLFIEDHVISNRQTKECLENQLLILTPEGIEESVLAGEELDKQIHKEISQEVASSY